MNNINKDIEIVEHVISELEKDMSIFENKEEIETYRIFKESLSNILNRLKEYDNKIIHLSDEEYRKVIDNAQTDLKSELAIKDKMIDMMLNDLFVCGCTDFINFGELTNNLSKDKDNLKKHYRREAEKNE